MGWTIFEYMGSPVFWGITAANNLPDFLNSASLRSLPRDEFFAVRYTCLGKQAGLNIAIIRVFKLPHWSLISNALPMIHLLRIPIRRDTFLFTNKPILFFIGRITPAQPLCSRHDRPDLLVDKREDQKRNFDHCGRRGTHIGTGC